MLKFALACGLALVPAITLAHEPDMKFDCGSYTLLMGDGWNTIIDKKTGHKYSATYLGHGTGLYAVEAKRQHDKPITLFIERWETCEVQKADP